jgi:hypothetical protein
MEIDESLLEPLPLDGFEVARVRLHAGGPPFSEVRLGAEKYRYDRSYPVKGHGANLPRYLREQMASGKKPLVIERVDRFYVYLTS